MPSPARVGGERYDHTILTHTKEGPYQDRPLLCPFRLLPLLTCS